MAGRMELAGGCQLPCLCKETCLGGAVGGTGESSSGSKYTLTTVLTFPIAVLWGPLAKDARSLVLGVGQELEITGTTSIVGGTREGDRQREASNPSLPPRHSLLAPSPILSTSQM